MDIRQLEIFKCLADRQSFSQAAEELHLSQPTVSAHLQALEQELRKQLIHRTTRAFYLTEDGRKLYRYAQQMLALRQRALADLSREHPRELSVGTSSVPGVSFVPQMVSGFLRTQPDTRLYVTHSDSMALPLVAAILVTPLWVSLSEKLGKQKTYIISAVYFLFPLLGCVFAPSGSLVLTGILTVLIGVGISASQVLIFSILPDVVEVDELRNGVRREGVIYGATMLMYKISSALLVALVTAALGWFGYVESAGTAVAQTAQAVLGIRILMPVAAQHQTLSRLHITVDGYGSLLACGNRVNRKLRPRIYIAARKHIRLSSLIGKPIRLYRPIAIANHAGIGQQISPIDRLPNGHQYCVRRYGDSFHVVKNRSKTVLFIKNRFTALKNNSGNTSIVRQQCRRAPSVVDKNTFCARFSDFVHTGRHFRLAFQAEHAHLRRMKAHCGTGNIDRYIPAADNNHISMQLNRLAQIHAPDKVNAGKHTLRIFSIQPKQPPGLCANGEVKRLKTLFPQLGNSHVPPNFHTCAELNAQFLEHIQFCLDNLFFQAERGDAKHQHTAGLILFFKYCNGIPIYRQIIRAG